MSSKIKKIVLIKTKYLLFLVSGCLFIYEKKQRCDGEESKMNHNSSFVSVECPQQISNDERESVQTIEWWFDSVLHITICVIGLITNLLSIPVLLSNQMTNVFYRTLAFLAVFDFMFIACDVLESIRRGYEYNTCEEMPLYQTLHIYLFPKILRPVQNITMVASIYTTIVVALGRFLAVSKPISTMVKSGRGNWKNVIAYILPVIGFSTVFKLPIFFEFYTEWSSNVFMDTNIGHDNNCNKGWCMQQGERQSNLTLGRFIVF